MLRLFSILLLALAVFSARVAAQTYAITTLGGADDHLEHIDGPLATARFNIAGLVADAAGTIYFTDRNHTVRKIAAGIVSTIAGRPLVSGSADGVSADARFDNPHGIALDAAGNTYVADQNNHTIRKITPAGVVTTLAGRPRESGAINGAGAAARFEYPLTLASDAAGNLYVGEGNAVIRKVTPDGVVTTLAGVRHERGTADGPGTAARFSYFSGMATDRAGNLYVSEIASIRKITPTGDVSTIVGAQFSGHIDGPRERARLGVIGMALEGNGDLLIADSLRYTLRKVTLAGTVTTVAGQLDQSGLVDGLGGNARLIGPQRLAAAPDGSVLFVDAHGRVLRRATPVNAPAPPILHVVPSGSREFIRHVGAGTTLTFDAAASGATPVTLQWSRNGVAIAGATGNTLTLSPVAAADEGTYTITAQNNAGSVTSLPVTVRVYNPTIGPLTTRHSVDGGSFLWAIASGAGRLVAVGTNGTILTSSDGRTWTRANSSTHLWLVGVTYGAGKFVAVGDGGTVLISTDGLTWTRATGSATAHRLNNVVYGRNRWVAVGEAGTIMTSDDAQTWTLRSSNVTGWLRGLGYNRNALNNAGVFVATGQHGVVLNSVDGITWNPIHSHLANDIEGLTTLTGGYANFAGIGQDGVAININSTTFYSKYYPQLPAYSFLTRGDYDTGARARLRGIAQGANALFATGENGVVISAASIDGPWTQLPAVTSANLVGGTFHGNTLFIVGENETILQSQPLYSSRLINISTRGNVGVGASMLISGFVVTGDAPKRVLLRAAGPALARFGLESPVPRPLLTLFDGANRPIAHNGFWSSSPDAAAIEQAAREVGAFPFAPGSPDAALLVTLPPGAYTAQVAGEQGALHVGLVEAYDAEPLASEGARAINISTRGEVGVGGSQLIAGFVINGAASRRVLIRAVGPSLAPFGLTGLLAEPRIQVYDSRGLLIHAATAWSLRPDADEIRGAARLAGAFALQEESRDAALVATLLPGSYTVQVSGVNNTTGLAMVEVYDLP